jgi:hypothetical protein
MQALSDEQRIDSLEKKVEEGFSQMRAEFRESRKEMREDLREVRGEIGALYRLMIQSFAGLGFTMILGFAALLLQHHL